MDVINQAVHVLKDGGTILYPTETVWGMGCLSNQPKAIDKIFDGCYLIFKSISTIRNI